MNEDIDSIEIYPSSKKEVGSIKAPILYEDQTFLDNYREISQKIKEERERKEIPFQGKRNKPDTPHQEFSVDLNENNEETALLTQSNNRMNSLEEQKEINVKKTIEKVKRTYGQNWHWYNRAMTREKIIVLQMIKELLSAVCRRPNFSKQGRPSTPLDQKIYCMFLYVYQGWSSRRTISDVELSRQTGYLSDTYHFNSILNWFSDTDITPILTDMIRISSLPLRPFEKNFAQDATGFSTSVKNRWLDVRTQKESKKKKWIKLHAQCGVKTKTITSLTITEGSAGDSPELIPLTEQTNRFFDMESVLTDKAYLSRLNMQALAEMGIINYTPFKSNSVRDPKGCTIWATLFDAFHLHNEQYMEYYHKRSNGECLFHMLKSKLGNHLRTKKFESQTNEVLMKCLVHNLIVLVHEMMELAISIDLSFCADEYFAQEYP